MAPTSMQTPPGLVTSESRIAIRSPSMLRCVSFVAVPVPRKAMSRSSMSWDAVVKCSCPLIFARDAPPGVVWITTGLPCEPEMETRDAHG